MALKKFKPTSPGVRHRIDVIRDHLYKGRSLPELTVVKHSKAGRNSNGRITVRHQGGGHKQHYRIIDFKRIDKDGIPAKVERIEYDPNRTAHIALLLYVDGERRYIIASNDLDVGVAVMSGKDAPISIGNNLPLHSIPDGTVINCVELQPGKGAQMARSAGSSVQLLGRDAGYAILRLRSGEMRKVLLTCRATIGSVSNGEHNLEKIGKAGRVRWRGKRPTVRGVAMNPVDHPLGGGEGRTSGGRPPCSPWGLAEGTRTRRKGKSSNKLIIRSRSKAKGGRK